MASFITAGNATNGLQVSSDNTGILELRTGTGSGTTAVTFSTGQNATFAGTVQVAGVSTSLYPLVSGTSQTASGSSVDFTGIPSWVKRITVTFTDVSFAANGSSRLRLGTSGGLVSSGYVSSSTALLTTPAISVTSITDGLAVVSTGAAATVVTGQFTIVNITGNTWQSNGFSTRLADSVTALATGYIALSGTLDRLSVVATISTFDAGTINILYE